MVPTHVSLLLSGIEKHESNFQETRIRMHVVDFEFSAAKANVVSGGVSVSDDAFVFPTGEGVEGADVCPM